MLTVTLMNPDIRKNANSTRPAGSHPPGPCFESSGDPVLSRQAR